MNEPIPHCMGGWCTVREGCAHHLATLVPGQQPAERLCDKEAVRVPVIIRREAYSRAPETA